jgi:23S rRNA (uracil1939-C5)-methyltransferase
LIVRHLEAFTQTDLDCLTHFAEARGVYLFLQPGGLKTVHAHYPETPQALFYRFDEFEIKVEFLPTDFIQVNKFINNRLVSKAIELLDVQAEHRVLDLFCGVGNFTLPLSRKAKSVIGVEGDKLLVERAQHNIGVNQLDNVEFFFGDLFKEDMNAQSHGDWLEQKFDRLLIDPPRSGATEIVRRIEQFNAERIVYVSCNPATLARDADTLVNEKGYTLEAAGVIDMFPHTAHVESIAVFQK